MKSKKKLLFVLVLLTVTVLSITGCGKSDEVVNPMVEKASLAEIETALGYTFDKLPNNITNLKLYTVSDTIAQADFTLDNINYTARKAKLIAEDDISGVYVKFDEMRTVTNANGEIVVYQFNSGAEGLATWSNEAFNYSVYCPTDFSNTLMEGVVDQIQ